MTSFPRIFFSPQSCPKGCLLVLSLFVLLVLLIALLGPLFILIRIVVVVFFLLVVFFCSSCSYSSFSSSIIEPHSIEYQGGRHTSELFRAASDFHNGPLQLNEMRAFAPFISTGEVVLFLSFLSFIFLFFDPFLSFFFLFFLLSFFLLLCRFISFSFFLFLLLFPYAF